MGRPKIELNEGWMGDKSSLDFYVILCYHYVHAYFVSEE